MKHLVLILFFLIPLSVCSQNKLLLKDSTEVRVHPSYNDVSARHRKFFGENYRKEWAAPTKLPVLKISEIGGGLKPTQLGGGNQSHSLRLEDKAGVEWVLRSVEKYSEGLAPKLILGSVYEKWVDDNFSAQHPYSALIVPVLAEAVNVPHTNPVIGMVAADNAFGEYEKEFAGTVCLLEKREPEGDSDNTIKMLQKLDDDNDNKIDTARFFRARLLDLLIADWGRHEDQWRWVDKMKGNGKDYLVVPRDRDQVFYVNEGFLPKKIASTSLLSFLEGFNPTYGDINAFFINGRKLNQQFLNQYSYSQWMQMTKDFVAAVPDKVLMEAVNQLPASSLALRKTHIFETLKGRRDNMVAAMDTYYHFLYNIVDVRTSDKNEFIEFTENADGSVNLRINKLTSAGVIEKQLFSNSFQPNITKEIRLFAGKGNDIIKINLPASDLKVRVVGGDGQKTYELKASKNKVYVYENLDNDIYTDPEKSLRIIRSNDTLNTKKVFSNLYSNSSGISPTADLRSIDGLFLGLGYKITREGFRKEPYGSRQKFSALKSLNSKAIMLQYNAEWISIFKNTDLKIDGLADTRGNILNFFGRGNDTNFDQTGDFRTYYRANFSFYQLEPVFRIQPNKKLTITAGPSIQHFTFNPKDNVGRNIISPAIRNQYDNLTQDKTHAGMLLTIGWDTRDSKIVPSKGLNFSIRMQGYEGLNKYSNAYAQVFPQVSFFQSLDSKGKVVLANRTGAGFTFGQTEFYQSAFLGSQDNLLGFRKFRFAGDNLIYNNFEARVTLPNFIHYVLPGKIGLIGFYDAGRVWIENDQSNTIHHGYGGGIFLAPFNRLFIRAVAGFSDEGLQPSIALRQRF
ncbi:MAG: BamA/TamA family outer membrane protein [Pyrinomonadaceae bacterium]|nr:BamA/TamA family outer membrane protein [Sphingobacteriaceae bacterium]